MDRTEKIDEIMERLKTFSADELESIIMPQLQKIASDNPSAERDN